ncbi:MAG TPA: GspH/FimT family pseudopilin [Candidatus Eisenbacteria bacterium]|nr:GspH/FimT family pseudopilin [Candidatus Eisenbacteria bacterium]
MMPKFRNALRNEAGLTISELMVAVSILGILVAIGMPNFLSTLPDLRLNDAARQVATDLQQIRMKAIAQNIPYQATFSTGSYVLKRCTNAACSATTNDSGDIVLPEGITISTAITAQFQPRGTASNNYTVTLSNGSAQKWVCVRTVGRVRIQDSACS